MALSASLGVLLDHTQDKIVLLDESGRFTYVNEAVKRTLGWDPDTLLGENAFEYIHPEDVDAARQAFEETIASTSYRETTVEIRFQTSDETWVWMESRMSNLTDEALDGYVVSSRDISDRVEAQRDQRETTERLRELSAATGEVLWMFNGDWSEVLFINPAYEEVYGGSREELEADPGQFLSTVHPDDVPAVEEALECLSRGESVDMEYRVNPEKDYNVWVWVQAEPIIEDGEVVRITGFSRDVTDRHRRERQLVVMDKLLRHNIRNDLNVVLGKADLIEDQAPETAEHTAVIRQTGEALLASAEKEREIIKLLRGTVAPGRVDVRAVVETAISTVQDGFPHVNIAFSSSGRLYAKGIDELGVAVVELLENALMHSESAEPSVRVRIEDQDSEVTIVIEDNGTPIPPMEANVLTGDHEMTDIYHSTGLGLWLVYWIVALSDGRVTVDSQEGAGNHIRVHLPTRSDRGRH